MSQLYSVENMFNAFFSLWNPEFQVVKIIKMLRNDVISTAAQIV